MMIMKSDVVNGLRARAELPKVWATESSNQTRDMTRYATCDAIRHTI